MGPAHDAEPVHVRAHVDPAHRTPPVQAREPAHDTWQSVAPTQLTWPAQADAPQTIRQAMPDGHLDGRAHEPSTRQSKRQVPPSASHVPPLDAHSKQAVDAG